MRRSRRNATILLACRVAWSTITTDGERGAFFGGVPAVEAQRQRFQQKGPHPRRQQQRRQRRGVQQHPNPRDYYRVLGVPRSAGAQDIKSAYRKLALKYHPDKFRPDPGDDEARIELRREQHKERFVAASLAYDVLGDDEKRDAYDKYGQNGLDMLERGIDPARAGFAAKRAPRRPETRDGRARARTGSSGRGFGGFPDGGERRSFGGGEAFEAFEQMFGGAGDAGGGGFGGGGRAGPRVQLPPQLMRIVLRIVRSIKLPRGGDFAQTFDNMGRVDGLRSLSRYLSSGIRSFFQFLRDIPATGGMGGTDGGGQEHGREASPAFRNDDPSGVVRLGAAKFPDAHAKHAWLLLFYDEEAARRDPATRRHVALAKRLASDVLRKAKHAKNGMLFKVGAVDCGGGAPRFCRTKLGAGAGAELPAFATVLNGSVRAVTDGRALKDARALYGHTTAALANVDGLVLSVGSVRDIGSRLFGSSAAAGRPAIAILLLIDTRGTSPLYASLAHRHRADGFAAFGASRGGDARLAAHLSVEKYPTLIALAGVEATGRPGTHREVSRYDGNAMDSTSLSEWLDGLSGKYFTSRSAGKGRKKQKVRS